MKSKRTLTIKEKGTLMRLSEKLRECNREIRAYNNSPDVGENYAFILQLRQDKARAELERAKRILFSPLRLVK